MKNDILNNGLQPPEGKTKWQLEREAFEEKALNWVKYCFRDTPEEIFDLYSHDREVAINFYRWALDYGAIHLADQLAGKYPTHEQLWEKFCQIPKQ